MKQLLLDIKPSVIPTLHNFVVGRNAEAVDSLNAAIKNSGQSNFIYFWGESGSGKSHLLSACKDLAITVVDNVHLLNHESQIALFNTYNTLKENNGILITAGLHTPNQMNLRDDLATRLAWGLVYHLQPLNDAEKMLALQNHAAERGMQLPVDVINYCLRYLRRDLSSLMTILDALDDWSLTTKKPVTLPMLRQILQFSLNL